MVVCVFMKWWWWRWFFYEHYVILTSRRSAISLCCWTSFEESSLNIKSLCSLSFSGNLSSLSFLIADPAVEKVSIDKIRFFRVERSYAVRSGKWYFEFEVVTGGDMRVGWARPGCRPDIELGADDQAFVFEGSRVSLAGARHSSVQVFLLQAFLQKWEVLSIWTSGFKREEPPHALI